MLDVVNASDFSFTKLQIQTNMQKLKDWQCALIQTLTMMQNKITILPYKQIVVVGVQFLFHI